MNATQPKLFGTDGIRGAFGSPPLDEATVRRLGACLAESLLDTATESSPRVVLGGDTRDSTATLCAWLIAELTARDIECVDLGMVPTPCVAERTRHLQASCGVAVSASHNPHPDNGIKLIDAAGFKWSPERELALEQRLVDRLADATFEAALPRALEVDTAMVDAWLAGLRNSLDSSLDGLKIALDAGHGAASPYAAALFGDLGADVHLINAAPNGRNINAGCGSTHPEMIAAVTRQVGAHLGFAFDGDADRVIVVDEQGTVRDGDAVLYLWSLDLQRRGHLPGHRIVATTMSNLGLEVALRRQGIAIVRCDVGDRHVVSTMESEGIVLGGEQSGHIVNRELSTAGDGLLTALHIAALAAASGQPLSSMLADFVRFPQILLNVKVRRKPDLASLPRVQEARRRVEASLGDEGRLVLRYSGTEPLARVMLEGPDQSTIHQLAEELASVIAEEIG